jgi:hypothetical protein
MLQMVFSVRLLSFFIALCPFCFFCYVNHFSYNSTFQFSYFPISIQQFSLLMEEKRNPNFSFCCSMFLAGSLTKDGLTREKKISLLTYMFHICCQISTKEKEF